MADLKINLVAPTGELICTATATVGASTVTKATEAAASRTLTDAMDTSATGTQLEIIYNGKVHRVPVTSIGSSDAWVWQQRPLPALGAFNSSRTYTGVTSDVVTAVNGLGRGINLGQMHEAIALTGNPRAGGYRDLRITPEILRRLKLGGFDHVRIPVSWARQALAASPYTIQSSQVDAVKADVDAAIAAGFKVIINQHHSHLAAAWTGWASENGGGLSRANMLVRQAEIIKQVAQAFASYPVDSLFMELENEPQIGAGANGTNPGFTDSEWAAYWPTALAAVRSVDANRIILLGGSSFNSTYKLSALGSLTDNRTVLMAHPYEPGSTFTHFFTGSPLWSLAFRTLMQASIDEAYAQSIAYNRPCVMTEFGCWFGIPARHRAMYLRDVANACFEKGMPYTVWNAYGGGFDIFRLARGDFFPEMCAALTGVTPPAFYTYNPGDSILDWPCAYWGSGTGAANLLSIESVSVDGNTITIPATKNFRAIYVPVKTQLMPGDVVRFVISRTGSTSGKVKLTWVRIAPQVGNWGDGVMTVPMPNPADASSTPAWGDHNPGTYDYTVPVLSTDSTLRNNMDPWCLRIDINSANAGDTYTITATKI